MPFRYRKTINKSSIFGKSFTFRIPNGQHFPQVCLLKTFGKYIHSGRPILSPNFHIEKKRFSTGHSEEDVEHGFYRWEDIHRSSNIRRPSTPPP